LKWAIFARRSAPASAHSWPALRGRDLVMNRESMGQDAARMPRNSNTCHNLRGESWLMTVTLPDKGDMLVPQLYVEVVFL